MHSPDDMSLESDGGMILTGENRRTRRKTCPSATLPTTNPTWIFPGANPGLRGDSPATNHLSHGTAICVTYSELKATSVHLKSDVGNTETGDGYKQYELSLIRA
jgi:hypothetical protein